MLNLKASSSVKMPFSTSSARRASWSSSFRIKSCISYFLASSLISSWERVGGLFENVAESNVFFTPEYFCEEEAFCSAERKSDLLEEVLVLLTDAEGDCKREIVFVEIMIMLPPYGFA